MENVHKLKRYLSKAELIDYTGFSEATINRMMLAGALPYSKHNGRSVRYDIHQIDAYMESMQVVKSA